ncbi:hypothetical protein [Streptomyces sviceus]|uniref:hypothetical protein n=1 Tax=Streptomyces sviceus TaxID=285530 RepID=UPI0036CE63FE
MTIGPACIAATRSHIPTMRPYTLAAVMLVALSPLFSACSSDDDLKDPPYDAVAAGESPEPEPRPEETKADWEETYRSDLSTVYDGYQHYEKDELIRAGYAACKTTHYDYGNGDITGVEPAIGRVEKMLDMDGARAYEIVEAANRRLCEWSHLSDDSPMELPPITGIPDVREGA